MTLLGSRQVGIVGIGVTGMTCWCSRIVHHYWKMVKGEVNFPFSSTYAMQTCMIANKLKMEQALHSSGPPRIPVAECEMLILEMHVAVQGGVIGNNAKHEQRRIAERCCTSNNQRTAVWQDGLRVET